MRWPWQRNEQVEFAQPKPVDQFIMAMTGSGISISVDRLSAMSIPAMQRGRNLICQIATLPLKEYAPDDSVVASPLLSQLDPDVPNVVTLSQTVEDLLFDGISWWLIVQSGFDKYPSAVRHLDVRTVSITPPPGRHNAPLPSGVDPRGGVVWVDGEPVSASQIIRFDSPNPGVLKVSGRAIKRAVALDKVAALYAGNPRPLDYFTPSDTAPDLTRDEARKFIGDWKALREEYSTAYINSSLKYVQVDAPSPADLQLNEALKQAGLDIANALGIDPEDLGISTTSRTYANANDRRQDRINNVLSPYMRSITDRLSMPDVTKRGYRVAFDLDDFMKSNPTERWATYKTGIEIGAITVDEIRAKEDMPAMETPVVDEAERALGMSFSEEPEGTQHITFDVDPATVEFSADTETRTITGRVVPYGVAGKGMVFSKGGAKFKSAGSVKLLRDHSYDALIGKGVSFDDRDDGLYGTFKVAGTPRGDEALTLAFEDVLNQFSVGIDVRPSDMKRRPDGTYAVQQYALRETSLTPIPVFPGASVTAVALSEKEPLVADETPVTDVAVDNTPEAVQVEMSQPEERPVVSPVRAIAHVEEALPYRFDNAGRFVAGEFDFATDVVQMVKRGDFEGVFTDAGKRAMGMIRAAFDVQSGDVNELNPAIQMPGMYVDERPYAYPLWNRLNKGATPNGITPFVVPKLSSYSGLVADHVEGVEPTPGTFVTTSQTITPTPLSGKINITREAWDQGGNPVMSNLIWAKMVRAWNEGLETASATFLNTLTAAADIVLTTAAEDDVLAESFEGALIDLLETRSYDFSNFAAEKYLYKRLAQARDGDKRPLYPAMNPSNANGQVSRLFRAIDVNGLVAFSSWALSSTAASGSSNNSWLWDVEAVHGWSTAPQRLEFAGSDTSGDYAPVAEITLAIWGYKAFACTDIAGVRQVTYDPVS